MISLTFAMSGLRMTRIAAERVKLLEKTHLLLVTVKGRLEYYREPVDELIDSLCRADGLGGLFFLEECRRLECDGMPFCDAWKKSVLEGGLSPPFKKNDLEQLLSIGAAIGSANLDSQLVKLTLYEEILNETIIRARTEADKNGKVYTSLGVSAGIIAGLMIL
ncbi:MAG: hypothetical protein GX107_02755 [Clostridiales bacterium]|nr:hypothetical protein [Clostridiales bacterium]